MDLSKLVAGFTGGGSSGGGGSSAASTAALAAAGPYGAAIGAVAGALSTPTSSGVSGDEKNSYFSNAGSGWNVATGRGNATGAPVSSGAEGFGLAGAGVSSNVLLIAGAAVVVALLLTRKGR